MDGKRSTRVALLLATLGLLLSLPSAAVSAKVPKILEFDTMVGVPEALTGSQAPIRGVNGGGIPWTLTAGRGELTTSGHLEIQVDGLVLADGMNAGNNPIPSFRGLVSCLDADGMVQNVSTDLFPAITGPAGADGGDAKIEADLALPQPCIAPIVFVTSGGGSWFASTGG
ncbi:MAG: hypothetical protein ACRDHD_06890 [Candidatus Limnocylindria bacterium]